VGLIASVAAQILGWLAWLFLSYLVLLVRGFDALPCSSLAVAAFPASYVWGYYAILAGVVALVNRRTRLANFSSRLTSGIKRIAERIPARRLGLSPKWLILPLLLAAILVWSVALTTPDGKLHVSFLDVGQGDAILIRMPNGQDILIDGGPDPQRTNLELGKKLPFWDRTIDLVVCTQPQADHITGLIQVLQRYSVKQVLDSGIPYETSICQEWLRLIEDKGIEYSMAQAGQEIELGNGIMLEVLNPPESLWEGTSDDVNNNGVVLRLSWGQISFLFTADITEEVEFELIGQRANLKSTVLKMTPTQPAYLAPRLEA